MNDNELIARFMGAEEIAGLGLSIWIKSRWEYSFHYNTSWDWLMPVVEKIAKHVYETIEESNGYKTITHTDRAYPRTFAMIDSNGNWMVRINRMPLEQEDSLIKATYQAVVEWIKQYNA